MNYNVSKNLIEKIAFGVICAGIFLFSLMFPILNSAAVIIVMALFVCYRLIVNKGMAFDWRLGFLILAVLPMAIVDFHAGELYSFTYGAIWCLAYLTGKLLITEKDKNNFLFVPVLSMAIGLLAQGILNYYNCHIYAYKTKEYTNASWPEFWTGIETSRSLIAFDFVPIAALFVIGILLFNKKRIIAITIFLLSIIGAALDFFVGEGRFTVCIIMITILIIGGIYLKKNKQTINNKAMHIIKVIGIILMALLIVSIAIVNLNLFGLGDLYEDSFLARDGGIFNNIRFQSIKEAIYLAVVSPAGGWNVPSIEGGAPHNVWLLFAREYDSVILIILLAFLVLTIKDFITLARKKNLVEVDYMVLSVYLAINIYFMLETGPWRYRNYWFFILLIDGILHSRVKIKENE